jgi:hypothetical protein
LTPSTLAIPGPGGGDETGSTTLFTQQEDLNSRLRNLSRNDLDLRLKRFSDIYTNQALPWISDETGFMTQPNGEKNEDTTSYGARELALVYVVYNLEHASSA